MVRNPLFTSGFSHLLTYFPGIVHGELPRPLLCTKADDDTKCMTSRLWAPFGCSPPNVNAVFLHGFPWSAWPSDSCAELNT